MLKIVSVWYQINMASLGFILLIYLNNSPLVSKSLHKKHYPDSESTFPCYFTSNDACLNEN